MGTLIVRLDSVAALREAGGTHDPDPVVAAALAELAGAGGVSLDVGVARRAAAERDLRILKETVRTFLNVCLPPQDEWVKLVLGIRPDLAMLTPPRPGDSGGEMVLDVEDRRSELQPVIEALKSSGIATGLVVDPDPAQLKAAHRIGAAAVLLHTGRFCWAEDGAARGVEFDRLMTAAKIAGKLGLAVHVGGGLGYRTVSQVAAIQEIEALHVGHSLAARACMIGMVEAVRELLRMLSGPGGSQ
ncbi:MAG TPA: pyridoxine 5'-phosphate synthase [Candidatus Methylomirabilis sp.]|nr:pyridoxine 5'-phosphate synthase [Candidatus Methylomirabilis sp.]